MTTVWIIPKNHLQDPVPSWFLFACKLIRYQGWLTEILCSLVRSTKIPFWSPIRPPFNWIPNGLGGRELKFVYRFSIYHNSTEKNFCYRWVFTIMRVDRSYWRVQTFWGDMGTSETLLKMKSLEGANCNGRAHHHCSGNSSIFYLARFERTNNRLRILGGPKLDCCENELKKGVIFRFWKFHIHG